MSNQNKVISLGLLLLAAVAAWYLWNKRIKNQVVICTCFFYCRTFMPLLTYKVDKVYDASAPF